MGCYCNGKYHYTNMISALATGQISYKDAMCEILKRLCELENGEYSQVQADWTETETDNPAYIKNKPSVLDLQADWKNSDTNSYGYIKNKPTIPPEQVQADWTETNVSSKAFIKNKPAIPSAQVQSDWNETDETEPSFIQNKPGVTQANMTTPTLVPPTTGVTPDYCLHSDGRWWGIESYAISWDQGINPNQKNAFQNIINRYQNKADWAETNPNSPSFIQNKPAQLFPTFGKSRGTNLFGMSTDPRNDDNDWSIIQHWPYVVGFERVNNHYWKFHITAYIADYTCTIPYETMQFFDFGFNAELVFANSGLTWDVYKAAYNAGRTYSCVKYFSPGSGTTINPADVGLNATYTNAGGYLGMSDATGSGSVVNTLTMGRYFNNAGNETVGFGLWPLQNFQQGSWFEADLWVWL